MVSWTQICAGEQLATMTFVDAVAWMLKGDEKKVQNIIVFPRNKGLQKAILESTPKFLENKNWGLCNPEITRTIFGIPMFYDQWIQNYERKHIQSWCSTWEVPTGMDEETHPKPPHPLWMNVRVSQGEGDWIHTAKALNHVPPAVES